MKWIKKQWKKFKKKFSFLKKIKKPNFTKLIVFLFFIYTIRVMEFTLNMVKMTFDLSPLLYIVPTIIGITGTIINYYIWKSKNENIQKQANNPDYIQPTIYEEFADENNNDGEGI